MRINKYLAEQKIASRREADAMIESGEVLVNGKKAVLGQQVSEGDTIELVGKPKKHIYLAYYKGRGVITHSPAEHEIDIATRLKKDYGITGIAPIGRLDKDSEGLMILTDDGRLTGPLLDPEAKHEKEYDVTLDKVISTSFQKIMSLGVDIEGYKTKPAKVDPNPKNPKRFKLTITEGKKHQIRRMCAALGFQVQSLKRVRIMNVELGSLKPNQYRKITDTELNTLLGSLDLK
ncbi:MAG: pseudouridine synthase [Candidatus Paceibacterota bacterium]